MLYGLFRFFHIDLLHVECILCPEFQPRGQEFLDVKGISWVCVRSITVIRVLRDIIFFRQGRTHTPLQHLPALRKDRAFRSGSVKTEF